MNCTSIFALGVAALALTCTPALAQDPPAPLKLTAHALTKSIYWVEGGKSNSAFVVGDKGVVVIDAQLNDQGARLVIAEIAKVTSKPINTLVITHFDPDHVGGIRAFPVGTAIIEQENTRSGIQVTATDSNGGPANWELYRDLVAKYQPAETIGEGRLETINGVRMQFRHVAAGHTSGDLIVYLPDQKVVFAGDVIMTNAGRFPVVHNTGSSLGWIQAMKAILALDADIYVSGHGPVETKAQLEIRLKDAEVRRDQIKALVYQGKTLAEVKAALPETIVNPIFHGFNATTYNELVKGYPEAKAPWTNLVPH